MLTAYDYPMARLLDEAGVDIVLVGDSLAMVVMGLESTAEVTLAHMLHHAQAVRRGVSHALLVVDLPAESLRGSPERVRRDAQRLRKETGCEAVKVEWRPRMDRAVRVMVHAGIPVMGHVGLTPQTAQVEGGFGYRGKDAASAQRIINQALQLEAAGCWSLVIECVPDVVAEEITQRLRIPTIGIGAGRSCDGQVLVTHDLLGLYDRFHPRFVKRYAQAGALMRRAMQRYCLDVRQRRFPASAHSRPMAPVEAARLRQQLNGHA